MSVGFLGHYQYLLDMVENSDVINDYRLDGGRWGAKTTQVIIALSVIANNYPKTIISGIRHREVEATDGTGMEQQFKTEMDSLKIKYKFIAGKNMFELPNGSKIFIRGAVGMDGQPKFSGKDFGYVNNIIVFTDEIFDFKKREWDAVREGHRGKGNPNMIYIRANNNWEGVNWYVDEISTMLPFDLNKLMNEGEQYGIVGKTLIHHTNVVLNKFMENSPILDGAIEDAVKDNERAKISLWGFPGTLNGALFNDYTQNYHKDFVETNHYYINDLGNEITTLTDFNIGITLLDKRRTLGAVLTARDGVTNKVVVLKEYVYEQAKDIVFKKMDEIHDELANEIESWYKSYALKHNGVNISYVGEDNDYTKVATIRRELDARLKKKKLLNYSLLAPDKKIKEIEFIDLLQSLVIEDRIYINNQLDRLLAEMDSASYDETGQKLNDLSPFVLVRALMNSLTTIRHTLKS